MSATHDRLPYRVRRSARARRARLTVGPLGEVVVVLPARAPTAMADALMARHAGWVARHRERALADQARLSARLPLEMGRPLIVSGRTMRVELVKSEVPPRRGRVDALDGRLLVHPGRDGRVSSELLDAWLRERARGELASRIAARAVELRVEPGRLSIRDQRSRWGSASSSGDLSLSWRLVLAPPWVLDAVVVHELAHLRVRGHGPAFWRLVLRHAPGSREARRWLREHETELRAALD
jgi:hypothetical protein